MNEHQGHGHEGHEDHSKHAGHEGGGGHDHRAHHKHMAADFRRRFWVSLGLTVPVLALSPMIQGWLGLRDALAFPYDRYVQAGLATIIFFYGGWPFLNGLFDELRGRRPGMMTLIGLAITVAYVYSMAVVLGLTGEKRFFWELATLIDVMLLGHWLEMRSVLGAGGALEELVKLMPAEAHRIAEDGSVEEVKIEQLAKGDRVLIKPGEKTPVDGVIVEGRTTMNQAMLTGESKPVEKGEGDEVVGGAINGESAVKVEVSKTGDETYLSQVVETVRSAQQSRSRTQDLADRAALWLTVIALAAGATTLAAWWLIVGRAFSWSLERTVTVMVITCPHALGLAIPLVVAVSTALAARRGLLIRDRSAFERARGIDAVVFDKTGTLTEGRFGVEEVIPLDEWKADAILRHAAAVESQSEHSIARGIVETAQGKGLDWPEPRDFQAIPGKGAQAQAGEHLVKVVSPGYLAEHDIGVDSSAADEQAAKGRTVVYVLADDQPVGAIALADVVRQESRQAVRQLREMGVQVMMLTGDARAVAESVAGELGLDDYFAEVLPDAKAEKVRQVRQRGLTVAMVGDGVNDAPALVAADVGVAIGAGTDVAIESADIVLVKSDPRAMVAVTRLSRKTYSKMVQNLFYATAYNAVAIPLAAGALAWAGFVMPPAVGAIIMSLSTVVVAVNARLLSRAEDEL